MQHSGLSCKDLTVSYRKSSSLVLDRLNLEFKKSSLVTLTGPSGSGKSTLLYTLALMLNPSDGGVYYNGIEISALCDAERAKWRANKTGFIFQDAMLDPARSILDNVCEPAVFNGLPRFEAESRAMDLLSQFGVGHRTSHKPGEVSGGQAQRVGLCRALLNYPEIVFADEPTGNLDSESAETVWDALTQHAKDGATVIVATHNERLANLSDCKVQL